MQYYYYCILNDDGFITKQIILDKLIEAVDENAYFIETKLGRPKLFTLNRLKREYQIIDLIDLYNLENNGIYKIPPSKTLYFSTYNLEKNKTINILKSQNSMFNQNYFAFYKTPFFDDNCDQIPIPKNDVQQVSGYCNTHHIIVFNDFYTYNLTYMIYKQKKYKINKFTYNKCIYMIDIDNDIGLTLQKQNSYEKVVIVQLLFSGDTVTLKTKLRLNQTQFYMSDIIDFEIGKKIICFGTSNTWKFYDLLTYREVKMSPDSSPIKFGEYYDILSYQSVIIFGNIVYDISFDKTSDQVRVIQRKDQKNKYYTLPIKDHRHRQFFSKGKTLIADDENHDDKNVYLYSIENIICRDTEHITNNLQCIQCKNNEYFKDDICVGCPQGTFFENNICIACMQGCISCDNKTTCIICDQGYYKNNLNECKLCNINCKTCQNDNPDICASCNSPKVLQTKDQTCVDVCDSNQYLDNTQVDIPKCRDCDILCLKCVDAIFCQLCVNGNFLNTNTSKCELCDAQCTTCENGTDNTKMPVLLTSFILPITGKKMRQELQLRLICEHLKQSM
ncbi:zinc finger lsd1 subclass family protein, putative [Ichthyophthirius multifiliis]|uniref:Zinc finger lsd1 subclass family protein, putative n=1 Tax=Ichthyophthirius multifiliis TaxID=5932 RepID=G0QQP1_ICHMU|nr:zinc finger lsd1 subclass family protein, putative [Ichthyophthirius multifiliis]EGR32465.1 zinc finger lsd1 subclass family protein, putative [Ichthyophthirius multifiliis]|eukprot:XP_004036451.1 zinc finger lsd1 subclass family protein, putative [Ichthyophthirius multifiliis]